MPPVAAIRSPATLRSLTSHIGSLHDDRLAASESSSTMALRLSRGAPATGKTSICSVPAPTSCCSRPTHARRGPGRCATGRCAPGPKRRRRRAGRDAIRSAEVGESAGWILRSTDKPLLVDRRDRALIGHLGIAQRGDRAIHAVGQRRRVEIAQHRAAIVAGAAHEALASGEIDEKAFHRLRNLLQRQAAAPRAQLRARPVDFGRAEIAGIELVHQQHIQIFLLDRPRLRGRPGGRQRHRLRGRTASRTSAGRPVQLDPFGRNPSLVLEHAQLGVGAVEMDQSHEHQRQHRLPARVVRLRHRALERRLIGKRERLAHLPQRLPDAIGELGRALDVLDVLLDQLAAIGAERGVDELDGVDAVQVDRRAALCASRRERE